MFKVSKKNMLEQHVSVSNNKDTRAGASIVNFEHISLYSTINIAEFQQINASWA